MQPVICSLRPVRLSLRKPNLVEAIPMKSGPRSKQFGYLFTKAALQLGDKAIYRTIAHEIAHVKRSLPLQDASRCNGFS